jgi:hypothetical protein
MGKLVKPTEANSNSHYWSIEYPSQEIENFINAINTTANINLSGKSIYLDKKGISQDKIRNAGIKIKRTKADADIIIIDDIRKYGRMLSTGYYSFNRSNIKSNVLQEYFDTLINEEEFGYTYMFVTDFYKSLYKYEGNKELFINLNELFNSNNYQNTQMAMEMMTNANWDDNKIYLKELFNIHWYNNMNSQKYGNSVNFKGFLMSLDFNYKSVNYYNAYHYHDDCVTEEHHQFVFNKYDEEFKTEFNYVLAKYKIKVDEFKYSINFEKPKEDE